jgi:hypothetical protein
MPNQSSINGYINVWCWKVGLTALPGNCRRNPFIFRVEIKKKCGYAYSLLKASMGLRFAALAAGYSPESRHITTPIAIPYGT